jgi:VIT1/CCC1 family predicted Fe2+/Mn2+ transporter
MVAGYRGHVGVLDDDVASDSRVDAGLVQISAEGRTKMLHSRSHRHRDVQGGVARASVFGVSDGLVSNASLILGVAGGSSDPAVVRLAGIAGLIAGAVSMAAGEWVSMRAQRELFERELELERQELERNPHLERAELIQLYRTRGLTEDVARQVATQMMATPEQALEVHAREELGVAPDALGSPLGAAAGSFASFCAGAIVPLIPWFFTSGATAVLWSLVLAVVAAAGVGSALSTFTGRPMWLSAGRQVLIAVVAAGVTFGVGTLLGVSVS